MEHMREPVNVYKQIEELLKKGLKEDERKKAAGKGSRKKTYTSRAKGKLLIIDDKPDLLAELLKWCAANNYEVSVARSKKEADLIVKKRQFDGVIKSSEVLASIGWRKKKKS